MRSKSVPVRFVLLAVSILLMVIACRGLEVMIKEDRYTPSLEATEYIRYNGKAILLAGISNQASDTYMWGFQSQDRSITYKTETSMLESFLWYCYQKAFRSIGMAVYDQGYPMGTAEFKLTLLGMNDQEFKYKVVLLRDGRQLLDKDFTIQLPPPQPTDDMNELEKRAYKLIDLSVKTVLTDIEFSQIFLQGSAPAKQ